MSNEVHYVHTYKGVLKELKLPTNLTCSISLGLINMAIGKRFATCKRLIALALTSNMQCLPLSATYNSLGINYSTSMTFPDSKFTGVRLRVETVYGKN